MHEKSLPALFDAALSARLRALKKSRYALSRESGVSLGTIYGWGRGATPSAESLVRIAKPLNMTPEDLLRMAGLLAGDGEQTARIKVSHQIQSLDDAHRRWMVVMGARMGEDAADEAFWDYLRAQADTRVADAEAFAAAANSPLGGLANTRKKRSSRAVSGDQPNSEPPLTVSNQRFVAAFA